MFWYNFVSWVIIAIEVLVVAFIVGSAIKNRKFSLTENAWYFITLNAFSIIFLILLAPTPSSFAFVAIASIHFSSYINLIPISSKRYFD